MRFWGSSTDSTRTLWTEWSQSRSDVRSQRILAGVTERGVTDVMTKTDRLGQGVVESERGRHRPSHLGHLERVSETGDVVVAFGVEEDLGLVFKPAKGLGVDDPVAIALEGGPELVRLFCNFAALRFERPRCCRGKRPLGLLADLTGTTEEPLRHSVPGSAS